MGKSAPLQEVEVRHASLGYRVERPVPGRELHLKSSGSHGALYRQLFKERWANISLCPAAEIKGQRDRPVSFVQ